MNTALRRAAVVALVCLILVSASLVVSAAGVAGGRETPRSETAVVASIYDGDTLRLRDGRRVRLLQIDTPELGSGECYSRAARTALLSLAPIGRPVVLEIDPALDRTDRYGRVLRYVKRNGVNVNVELVRRGAAAPYFYRSDRGRYAATLVQAVQRASFDHFSPDQAIATGRSGPSTRIAPPTGKCDPNYAGGCVPPYPPDLDCADIRALGIAPVRVVGSDPHRLDGDDDGVGCE